MLQNKDTKNIWELKNGFTPAWVEPGFIQKTLSEFKYATLVKRLDKLKIRGYKPLDLLMWLISLPMLDQSNVFRFVRSPWHRKMEASKDTFYRLLKNPKINWRAILSLFVARFQYITLERDSIGSGPKCLIVDDTLIHKTGFTIEGVSRVFDHVSRLKPLGFKLLTLAYWDGKSFLPIDFSLHREKGTNKNYPFGLTKTKIKEQFKSNNPLRSWGDQRYKELDKSKIEMAIKMTKRALDGKMKVDYILMDSWFTCKSFLDLIKRYKKVHLIGMIKAGRSKIYYKNQKYSFAELRNKLGKPKRDRSLKISYLQAEVKISGHKVLLFYTRKNRNDKWHIILTSNRNLTFRETIKIYQIRWGIEVFFKEAKQLLKLGSCQSNSFNAQVGSITLTMIQYVLLTIHHRLEAYESKGQLFDEIKESYIQHRLDERLWGLLYEIMDKLGELFSALDAEDVFQMLLEEKEFWLRIFNFTPPDFPICKVA